MRYQALIIEPKEALQNFFTQLLQNHGFEVHVAENENDIESFDDNQVKEFNLIVIDEAKDPNSFCEKVDKIFNNPLKRPLPILGLTSAETPSDEVMTYKYNECLVKENFNIEVFINTIFELIKTHKHA